MLNFSSNDYLGLARHPLLVERAREWTALRGAGAQASRLVCGNLDLHEQVEAKLARLKGAEAALLLASGWQANAAVLPALLRAPPRPGRGPALCRQAQPRQPAPRLPGRRREADPLPP